MPFSTLIKKERSEEGSEEKVRIEMVSKVVAIKM